MKIIINQCTQEGMYEEMHMIESINGFDNLKINDDGTYDYSIMDVLGKVEEGYLLDFVIVQGQFELTWMSEITFLHLYKY